MGYTTRNNLYKPEVDEMGWGAEMNSNFDTIDSMRSIQAFTTVTESTYQVLNTDCIVLVDYPSGSVTITLPEASTCSEGQFICIKVHDFVTSVTVAPYSGDTIDEAGNRTLTSVNALLHLYCDGVNNWWDIP